LITSIGLEGEDAETVGHARDNSIASLAKIAKAHPDAIDLATTLTVVFNHVPLRHDKEEAKFVHDFIMDLCIYREDLMANV
jgi:hypothetical protein